MEHERSVQPLRKKSRFATTGMGALGGDRLPNGRFLPRIGTLLSELDTPSLVVDIDVLLKNISHISEYCQSHGKKWRPHVKGNKSPKIASMLLAAGASGVTCAKLGEAEVFARAGISDILIANDVVGEAKMARLTMLLEECPEADLVIVVDHPDAARAISQACTRAGGSVRLLIEVDIGMQRAGVPPCSSAAASLAKLIASLPGVKFAGLMGYEGHTLLIQEPEAKEAAIRESLQRLVATRDYVKEHAGLDSAILSSSGTGSFKYACKVEGITEIEAGGCIFSDWLIEFGMSAPEFGHALSVLATVTSRPTADRAIADSGKKSMCHWQPMALPPIKGRSDLAVTELNAEHCVMKVTAGEDATKDALTSDGSMAAGPKVGDKIELIPSYHDLTTVLHDYFVVVQNATVVDTWPIEARGRID